MQIVTTILLLIFPKTSGATMLATLLSVIFSQISFDSASIVAMNTAGSLLASITRSRPKVGPVFKVLHNFKAYDGADPDAALTYVGGNLYGVTSYGGTAGAGVAFSFNPITGKENPLHSFGYYDTDGATPDTRLFYTGGSFYGTTSSTGPGTVFTSGGTLFQMSPGGNVKILHYFTGGVDGEFPEGDIIIGGGLIYGTTNSGGSNADGIVYAFNLSTGKERILYNFHGVDGANPSGPLIAVGGVLYGTTGNGGAYGRGTAYELTLAGKERVLHSFGSGRDGAFPEWGLLYYKGSFYGTTAGGGGGGGTVFQIFPSGAERPIHRFGLSTSDAFGPSGGLTEMNGRFYGVGESGPCSGAIFSVDANGTESVLHQINGPGSPQATLVAVNGSLFGTDTPYENYCNKYYYGDIFQFTP